MAEMTVPFAKMNGIGNEIIVADMRTRDDRVAPSAAVALAAHEATLFDQLMAIHDPETPGTDARLHILNRDGSSAGACGNGMRCVTEWLHRETGQDLYTFETDAGRLRARRNGTDTISVDMGMPRFDWDQIPLSEPFADTSRIELQVGPIDAPILHTPSAVSMGNPHCVFWAQQDVNSYALDKFGPMLEHHMLFPEAANISVAQLTGENEITMRTWERGVGETRACGSAACAAAVSATRLGRTGRQVTVHLPGGTLQIDWRENGGVTMTGGTEFEFAGRLNPATGDWERVA